jgi:hypothetical protein
VDVDEGHWWFLSDRAPTVPVRQVSLLVLWEAEFDDAVAGVEPAGGDGFARVKKCTPSVLWAWVSPNREAQSATIL